MANIVSGNSSSIGHLDLSSNNGALSDLKNGKSVDFFQLISLLNKVPNKGEAEQTANGILPESNLNKSSSTNIEKITTLNKSVSELINLIGDFQTTDVDPAKSKINFSTLSQLKGIFEPTNQLSETDIDLDLANLLAEVSFTLKKLQGLKEFLAIEKSDIELEYLNRSVLELFRERVLTGDHANDVEVSLKSNLSIQNVDQLAPREEKSSQISNIPFPIKSLPFESGESGNLLIDIPEFDENIYREIIQIENFFVDGNKINNKLADDQSNSLDAFIIDVEISKKEIYASLSGMTYENATLSKKREALTLLTNPVEITVDVPNKNLSMLQVNVEIDRTDKLDFPGVVLILQFNGNLNSSELTTNHMDNRVSVGKASEFIANKHFEAGEFAIDKTQQAKLINLDENNKFPEVKLKSISTDFNVSKDAKFVDTISLDNVTSAEFAKTLKNRLEATLSSLTRKINFKKEISEFVEKSQAALFIQEVTRKVVQKEIGFPQNDKLKPTLFLSTADVIGYRDANLKKSDKLEKQLVRASGDILMKTKQNLDIPIKTNADQNPHIFSNNFTGEGIINGASSLVQQRAEQTNVQIGPSMNRLDNPQIQNFSQRISLLENQFSVRLSNSILQQAVNSQESFDLILEPETFGRVRVNVSIDSSQIDVKLIAENSTTMAILRSSESILQNISEQNGLKLAEYNVEMNNNAHSNQGSGGQQGGQGVNKNMNENVDDTENIPGLINHNEEDHSLNLIA